MFGARGLAVVCGGSRFSVDRSDRSGVRFQSEARSSCVGGGFYLHHLSRTVPADDVADAFGGEGTGGERRAVRVVHGGSEERHAAGVERICAALRRGSAKMVFSDRSRRPPAASE